VSLSKPRLSRVVGWVTNLWGLNDRPDGRHVQETVNVLGLVAHNCMLSECAPSTNTATHRNALTRIVVFLLSDRLLALAHLFAGCVESSFSEIFILHNRTFFVGGT
jgi:hypothetical protein